MRQIYSLWLHHLGCSEKIKLDMLRYFGNFESVYQAPREAYGYFNLKEKLLDSLMESKKNIDEIKREVSTVQEQGVLLIDLLDERYPAYLKLIPDPPIMLYVKGDIGVLNKPIIGIVGSRDCLEYGFEMSYKLAKELAAYGVVVASGMAKGIDGAAHQGALSSGESIGVLGTGINRCYPSCNRSIYNRLPKKGCLVTEYGLDLPPLPYRFPKRNRIISGMAMGILVVEADLRSGSLITTDLALEYNRDVFAVPGDARSRMSKGTNELIKKGAKCVTCAEDVIEELPMGMKEQLMAHPKNIDSNSDYELAQEERMVYAYVSWEPIFLNELLTSTKLSYEAIYKYLIQLELKGYIKKLPGERYVRA